MIRSPAVPSMRLKPLSSGCLVMSAGCGLVDHGSPPDSRGIEPLPASFREAPKHWRREGVRVADRVRCSPPMEAAISSPGQTRQPPH